MVSGKLEAHDADLEAIRRTHGEVDCKDAPRERKPDLFRLQLRTCGRDEHRHERPSGVRDRRLGEGPFTLRKSTSARSLGARWVRLG